MSHAIEILLVGGGGHAEAVLEVLRATGQYEAIGIIDPGLEAGTQVAGVEVLGGDEVLPQMREKVAQAFLCVGSVRGGGVRRGVFEAVENLGFGFPVLVHPQALIAPDVEIGAGTVVMPGAIVRCGAVVGRNVILNTGSIVEHHNRIGDHSHLATGARLAGDVEVGTEVLIGAGATVLQGRKIGDRATVGGGALVRDDVPAAARFLGVPAREV